jgi:hypothetical protein
MIANPWIDAHADDIPPALADQLRRAVPTGEPTPAMLVASAAAVLGDVLAADAMTRAQALELLTADALATFAFETAADNPATIAALADTAMTTFAALAVPDA